MELYLTYWNNSLRNIFQNLVAYIRFVSRLQTLVLAVFLGVNETYKGLFKAEQELKSILPWDFLRSDRSWSYTTNSSAFIKDQSSRGYAKITC
ncbi:hypothetical protein HI914_05042 [Erysiphe necator]|nr:hypothetical protein HI914_05042 [Erysiphe necator]